MNFNSLFDLFSQRSKNNVALITPSECLSVDDLLARAGNERRSWRSGSRPNIARGENVPDFVISLLAYDGFVHSFACEPRGQDFPDQWLEMAAENSRRLQACGRTDWVLATSGTTGTPKAVIHTLETLTSTTKMDFAGGSDFRWGLVYDPARFAGLQVVLQALLGGGPLVVPPEDGLRQGLDFMISERVTALSATPSLWRKMLMIPEIEALALRQITLGGEIADQKVLAALAKVFPKARIVHIYASTESGVGFAVQDGLAGFPVDYLQSGTLHGVDIQIGTNGNLMVRKKNAPRFHAVLQTQSLSQDGFVDTGDRVEIQNNRVLFLGRSSGAINVGGNKVMPEEIEAHLLQHSAVLAARVYAMPSSVLGYLVAADLQLKPRFFAEDVGPEILGFCRSRLERWQIPARVRYVDELDLSATGKIDRKLNHDG